MKSCAKTITAKYNRWTTQEAASTVGV